MIEVERKYRLTNVKFQEIKAKLLSLNPDAQIISQHDTVFLHGVDSFKDFSPGMPVIRIRTEDGHCTLTYKKALNEEGDSLEHEVGIDSASTMTEILQADNYRIVTAVLKDRLEIKQGHITYALDTVKRLGDFLEIEILTKDENSMRVAEAEIKKAALQFGLQDSDIEAKKYDQLLDSDSAE